MIGKAVAFLKEKMCLTGSNARPLNFILRAFVLYKNSRKNLDPKWAKVQLYTTCFYFIHYLFLLSYLISYEVPEAQYPWDAHDGDDN